MLAVLISLLHAICVSMRTRAALQLEILALRHQLHVLQRSRRRRLRLTQADRLLWIGLSRAWNEWRSAVTIVRPETVIAWQRRAFQRYWTWKSRRGAGRPPVTPEVRALIRTMSQANPYVGRTTDPRRVVETRDRREPGQCRELPRAASATPIPIVADLPDQSRSTDHGGGFLRGPDGNRSSVVRARDARAPPAARHARRCDGTPERCMDSATASRSLPGGTRRRAI